MEFISQTVIKMTIVKKNAYCPIFQEDDQIIIKKYCFDVELNELKKFCYDAYPKYSALRRQPIGTKDYFICRDNSIIEIELERIEDEVYNFER